MAFLNQFISWGKAEAGLFYLAIACLAPANLLSHAAEGVPEYKVKAAYICNFTKYIEWPAAAFADTNAPIVIGILGVDPFGDHLEKTVQGRVSQNRPVMIKRSRQAGELRGCHLLFISRSEKNQLAETLAALRDSHAVTICDTAGFFEKGVMIQLTLADQRVHFEVNLAAVDPGKISFNSRMLEAARKVWPRSKGPGP